MGKTYPAAGAGGAQPEQRRTAVNEYARIRNEHDRAVILAQLVNADARAMEASMQAFNPELTPEVTSNYRQSRAELWKLVGPTPDEASR